jgi:hypothetical protein
MHAICKWANESRENNSMLSEQSLLEKLIVVQLVEMFSCIICSPKNIYCVYKTLPLVLY